MKKRDDSQNGERDFLSVSEFAHRGDFSRSLGYQLVERGIVRAVRLSGHDVVRIPIEEYERFRKTSWIAYDGPIRSARGHRVRGASKLPKAQVADR